MLKQFFAKCDAKVVFNIQILKHFEHFFTKKITLL